MHDSETGEDYFNVCMYSSALGRFTSPDPGHAGLLALDAGVIGYDTYNCYQQGGQQATNGGGGPK